MASDLTIRSNTWISYYGVSPIRADSISRDYIEVKLIFSDAARENLQLISHNVQDAYFNRGLGWKKKKKKGKKGKKKKKK